MGHTRNALEKGFLDMYGLGGGGGAEPYFFENWPLPLTVWVFLPVLIRFQTFLPSPPSPITRCALGGRGG